MHGLPSCHQRPPRQEAAASTGCLRLPRELCVPCTLYALPWGRALRAALLRITAENAQLPHLGPKHADACSSPRRAHAWTGKLDRGMANRFSMGQTVIVSGFVSLRATLQATHRDSSSRRENQPPQTVY